MAQLKVFSNSGALIGCHNFNDTDKVAQHNLIACRESLVNNSLSITVEQNGFTILIDNRTCLIQPPSDE
ncbi:hypothetical protein [Anabaena azotica]|uniref:Uncharacterized protein n=1 Tax=Anabaena azotica FACHB-119 TaxID=947527 RepID=A0ABR8DEH4_9NOST|nr:hypothetical protein [Anabaena azotica]MBD2505332.1 hypothetical protein [Anabaena azotica FACHB-119]